METEKKTYDKMTNSTDEKTKDEKLIDGKIKYLKKEREKTISYISLEFLSVLVVLILLIVIQLYIIFSNEINDTQLDIIISFVIFAIGTSCSYLQSKTKDKKFNLDLELIELMSEKNKLSTEEDKLYKSIILNEGTKVDKSMISNSLVLLTVGFIIGFIVCLAVFGFTIKSSNIIAGAIAIIFTLFIIIRYLLKHFKS